MAGQAGGPRQRCGWAKSELAIRYHDEEWGVPVYDDRGLFEAIILGGAQAGLSWDTVLRKRENYRAAFDGFEPGRIARYDEAKVDELLQNAGIIRNRQKIHSAIGNARAYLELRADVGTLSDYMWAFVGGRPRVNRWRRLADVPATTAESERLSRDLKQRGFRFVGSTICYAVMQAAGLVNDHLVSCFRHDEVQQR